MGNTIMRVANAADATISPVIEPNCGIIRISGHITDAPDESCDTAESGCHA
jgi:hypothetical protein